MHVLKWSVLAFVSQYFERVSGKHVLFLSRLFFIRKEDNDTKPIQIM